jgi:hypothetical protein
MTTIKTAEFIRSNTDEDTLLTIKPRIYRRNMVSSYGYSIRGNDDTCIKRKNIEVNDKEPIFITFSVIKGATYFIKIDVIYLDESKQKYRMFYTVEDDFNQNSDKEEDFFKIEKDEAEVEDEEAEDEEAEAEDEAEQEEIRNLEVD